MRLKVLPADFRVREILDFDQRADGEYRIHLLHKEKLTTLEALQLVARESGIGREAIAHAGLKDRQGITEQWISIKGHAVELRRAGLRLSPVGRSDRPITSKMSSGNRFTVVVRDLEPAAAATVRRNLPSLKSTGFPNYFDDQRFGCLVHNQGFVMRRILRGEYQAALRQLVASPSQVAIAGDVKLKRILERLWGRWEDCADVARGHYGRVFRHLVAQPGDFRGALAHIPGRTRLIHAFAFQSYLWNLALSRVVRDLVPGARRIALQTRIGRLCGWRYLGRADLQRLSAMRTPLYGPEGDGGDPVFAAAMADLLRREGLRAGDFERHRVEGMVLREEPRPALIVPGELSAPGVEDDDVHRGRRKLTLSFTLPRGAYATMLVKRLFAPPMFDDRDRGPDRGVRRPGGGWPRRGQGGRDHGGRERDRGPRGRHHGPAPRTERRSGSARTSRPGRTSDAGDTSEP